MAGTPARHDRNAQLDTFMERKQLRQRLNAEER